MDDFNLSKYLNDIDMAECTLCGNSLADLFVECCEYTAPDITMDWILVAVPHNKIYMDPVVVDADPGFFEIMSTPEFLCCDNGIDVPESLAPGVYRGTKISVLPGEDYPEIRVGKWDKVA